MIKELGDLIAKEANTELMPAHRVIVARAVINWLSHQTPDEEMLFAAGGALGRLHRDRGRGNHHPIDDFVVQIQAAMAVLAK
jgi:hypothetical protein